jgi:ectoine hydroxylase
LGHDGLMDPGSKADFDRDGYLIVPGLFSAEEIALIGEALRSDEEIERRMYGLDDGQGGMTRIALWNDVGGDTLGLVPRLERVAGTAAALLGGEVYHYHSKVTSKPPAGGGVWDWHQDYGYWYKNGCLLPDMLSVAIAVSEQTEENGGLMLLQGSQRCGRIEHLIYGNQTAADVERVDQIAARFPVARFDAVPGDALFFHANTLHSSSANLSDRPRDVLLCAFNTAENNPVIAHHHPRYQPLETAHDDELLTRGLVIAGAQRTFLDPADDKSIEGFTTDPTR